MDDRSAFDRMFREWYARLFYFAFHFLKDTEACKDIVSDAFEYLWRNYDKVEEATVKTYLFTIVRTRCIDYLRRQNKHEEYAEIVAEVARRMAGTGTQEPDDRMARVRLAMEKLTPLNRRILEACFLDGKKYQEVAAEMGVSVAAIHKHIVKALRILRKELGEKSNRKEL